MKFELSDGTTYTFNACELRRFNSCGKRRFENMIGDVTMMLNLGEVGIIEVVDADMPSPSRKYITLPPRTGILFRAPKSGQKWNLKVRHLPFSEHKDKLDKSKVTAEELQRYSRKPLRGYERTVLILRNNNPIIAKDDEDE
jgi:hypothetical protein